MSEQEIATETRADAVMEDPDFDEINDAKANMDHIYNQPDPRAYFQELKDVGYAIPGAAKPILEKMISRLKTEENTPVRVLDLGCSYGINAALLKYDLSIGDLYEHWNDDKLADARPEEIVEHDRHFFSGLDRSNNIEMIGLDVAENAVAFAEHTGLLDDGVAADLECEPVPMAAKDRLATVDLVTSTGCVGYLTEKSFDRLMPEITKNRAPWLSNFVLRMFPFDAIEETLETYGYVTEKLEGRTFVQRQFVSDAEQENVVGQLRERGIDPAGKETEGVMLAELYLSRPREEAAALPLDRLMRAA